MTNLPFMKVLTSKIATKRELVVFTQPIKNAKNVSVMSINHIIIEVLSLTIFIPLPYYVD